MFLSVCNKFVCMCSWLFNCVSVGCYKQKYADVYTDAFHSVIILLLQTNTPTDRRTQMQTKIDNGHTNTRTQSLHFALVVSSDFDGNLVREQETEYFRCAWEWWPCGTHGCVCMWVGNIRVSSAWDRSLAYENIRIYTQIHVYALVCVKCRFMLIPSERRVFNVYDSFSEKAFQRLW